ncbi:Atp7b [Symbiodinium microadriaticum]|nr:Atp7b [Symbiodinium microadriaticum]
MSVCLALRLAAILSLPCAAVGALDRRLDGTTTTSSYVATSSLGGQAYAGAGEACSAVCSSWNYCCNDWQLGSNQYISCAQACMMRYRGESEDSIRSQCLERQCAADVGGFAYALCAKCEDLHDGCQLGVQDEWACYAGASVEVCQPSIYEDGKVVTLYHPSSKRYLGVGSYAGSGRRITALHGGLGDEIGSLWQLRFTDGGVQFLSVGQSGPASDFLPDDRPLGNDWFLAGCGMESVINVDAPRTFSIRQSISSSVLFSVSTHDLTCSPAGRFGAEWELLVEEFPRKGQGSEYPVRLGTKAVTKLLELEAKKLRSTMRTAFQSAVGSTAHSCDPYPILLAVPFIRYRTSIYLPCDWGMPTDGEKDKVPSSPQSACRRAVLRVTGMTCSNCSSAVERALSQLDFVERCQVDLINSRASIDYSGRSGAGPGLQDLCDEVENIGFEASVLEDFQVLDCEASPGGRMSLDLLVSGSEGKGCNVASATEVLLRLPGVLECLPGSEQRLRVAFDPTQVGARDLLGQLRLVPRDKPIVVLLLLGAVGTLCQWSTLTLAQVPAYMPPVATLRPGPRYDLAGRQPRYYQEEAVNLFFASAKTIRQEKGRPMRLQLAGGTGKTAIYTMIAQRALRNKPLARIVIFVPWKALAEQTHQKLTECGLKTCIVGDGFARVDRSVCVFNSACRLRGQGFAVKLIDEAHHTEGEGFFTNIMRHQIRADLEGDFSATFRASEVDYSYGFDKAVKDGYLCDMQSFILPLVARCKEEEYAKLVKIVTERKAEWSPMLILFNRIENAKAFSDILNAHDVPSAVVSHRDGRNLRQYHRQAFEDGELKVLCTVKVFNEGTDLPMLRSVIMAEPRWGTGAEATLPSVLWQLRSEDNKRVAQSRFAQALRCRMLETSQESELRFFETHRLGLARVNGGLSWSSGRSISCQWATKGVSHKKPVAAVRRTADSRPTSDIGSLSGFVRVWDAAGPWIVRCRSPGFSGCHTAA